MADTLREVDEALGYARNLFDQADSAYRQASKERTNAINELNAAQKKFDEVVAEVRKSAPADSDWKRQKDIEA